MTEEIDRENEQFNKGVTHTVDLLGKALGVTDWYHADGSEDYDTDLQQTLMNIMIAKDLYDPEHGTFAGDWQPIATAPTGDDDFFLVCCNDPADDRSPFVVRGSIFKSARKHPASSHLSMAHLTHWQPLPTKPPA